MGELSEAVMGSAPIGKNFAGKWPRGARIRQHWIYNRVGTAAVHGAGWSAEEVTILLHADANVQGVGLPAISPGHRCIQGSRPLAESVRATREPTIRRYCFRRQLKRRLRSRVPTFARGAPRTSHRLAALSPTANARQLSLYPESTKPRGAVSYLDRMSRRARQQFSLDPLHDQQA